MLAFRKSALGGLIISISVAALVGFSGAGSAQTIHKTERHKLHAPAAQRRLPPELDLPASTSAAPGSENHYFSDTVASGHTDLTDQGFRYGQSRPYYGSD